MQRLGGVSADTRVDDTHDDDFHERRLRQRPPNRADARRGARSRCGHPVREGSRGGHPRCRRDRCAREPHHRVQALADAWRAAGRGARPGRAAQTGRTLRRHSCRHAADGSPDGGDVRGSAAEQGLQFPDGAGAVGRRDEPGPGGAHHGGDVRHGSRPRCGNRSGTAPREESTRSGPRVAWSGRSSSRRWSHGSRCRPAKSRSWSTTGSPRSPADAGAMFSGQRRWRRSCGRCPRRWSRCPTR